MVTEISAVAFRQNLGEMLNKVQYQPLPPGTARDAADLPVLDTLLSAQADYLITGDQDLLFLADRYPIVTPAEFWRRHGA